MPQYLVANYLPDNFDPSTVTEAMMEEIHALNREMIAAGVRKKDITERCHATRRYRVTVLTSSTTTDGTFLMKVQEQIQNYIVTQPEPKRGDMQELHRIILEERPACKLWFLDGKNSEGKTV